MDITCQKWQAVFIGKIMLKVENLNFYYGEHHVLNNISFNADKPELWALMGPNGGGKTTLFKCIMGFLKPDSGNIVINNYNYKDITTPKMAKLISYVPQEHKPPFPFTVREIVLMGRSPYMNGVFGLKNMDYEIVDNAMEKIGILDIAHKPVTSLSGGQRQLVLIARAIAQDTPIMILDEPTSALDFNNQIHIWKILKKISSSDKLIIACSHDPNHIIWFTDKTIAVKNGEIKATGHTKDIVTAPLLKEIYGSEYYIANIENKNIICPVI